MSKGGMKNIHKKTNYANTKQKGTIEIEGSSVYVLHYFAFILCLGVATRDWLYVRGRLNKRWPASVLIIGSFRRVDVVFKLDDVEEKFNYFDLPSA